MSYIAMIVQDKFGVLGCSGGNSSGMHLAHSNTHHTRTHAHMHTHRYLLFLQSSKIVLKRSINRSNLRSTHQATTAAVAATAASSSSSSYSTSGGVASKIVSAASSWISQKSVSSFFDKSLVRTTHYILND